MWQKPPLVCLAIPFIIGMCGAHFVVGVCPWRLDMLFVLLCGTLMFLAVCYHGYDRAPLFRRLFAGSLFTLCLLTGFALYIIRYRNVAQAVDVQQTCFVGVATDAPQQKTRSVAVPMKTLDGAQLLLYLQTSNTHSPLSIRRGDSLWVQPRHITSTCPLTFSDSSTFRDYNAHLFYDGVTATCYVPADRWQHRPPVRRDMTWNERLHNYYLESALDSTTVSMVEALTIGRRQGLSRQLRNEYSAAGVAHVLALSGMHLGLLLGFFNLLIFRFLMYEQRRWAMLAVIPLLWVFAYVADMPPSLVRATVMATFLQLGFALGRSYVMVNALALAAIVMLAWNPLLLHHVGFQLSFLSMVGVALIFKPLFMTNNPSAHSEKRWIRWGQRCLQYFYQLAAMTVSTTLLTAPVVAYHFGQLPVYSLVTNLVVPMLLMFLMIVVFVWLLLFFWPWAQLGVGYLLTWLVGAQNLLVHTIASWPAATWHVQPTAVTVVLYYILLGAVLWIYFKRRSLKFLST